MLKQVFLLMLTFAAMLDAAAQNPRLSMYEASPLHVNPAYAGKFMGRVRAGAHGSMMRTDSAQVLHTTAFADYNLKYDPEEPEQPRNIGVGIQYYRYGGSDFPLSASFISLSTAYHTRLDKRGRHYGGFGIQAAYASGQLRPGATSFYDKEISGGGFRYRAGDSRDSAASHSYIDFSMGMYYAFRTNQIRFEAGLAMFHLFYPPNDIFQADPDIPRLRHRGVFNMKFDFDITDTRTIHFKSMYWADGLYWLSTAFDSDNLVAFWNGVELHQRNNMDKNLLINYGVHTRNFRTVMPMVSLIYNRSFNLRASYEMPVNSKRFTAYTANRAEVALLITLDLKGKVLPYTED